MRTGPNAGDRSVPGSRTISQMSLQRSVDIEVEAPEYGVGLDVVVAEFRQGTPGGDAHASRNLPDWLD